MRLCMLSIECNAVGLDVDAVACRFPLLELDIISDLALDAHIGDEPVHGLWINAGTVPCIGITVGVAVRAVKQEEKVMAAGWIANDRWNGSHRLLLLFYCLFILLSTVFPWPEKL